MTLKTRCRAREITVGENGMANDVIYYDEEGRERRQQAEMVILACNGIGTSRLLLNSRSRQFPDGLANRSGMVGRNLMFKGPIGCCVTSQQFYETDRSRGFVRGYTFEILRSLGPLATAMGALHGTMVPWGEEHRHVFDRRFGRSISITVICEDLPEPENRVELDPNLVDGNGVPAPKVIYRMSENSATMIEHGAARAREVLDAAGAGETSARVPAREGGWHMLGTARMGTDPVTSVVNPWGRSHDVRNLFIVDGSIFVTAAGVNPTSTIQALALYIGDAIKKNLANLFD